VTDHLRAPWPKGENPRARANHRERGKERLYYTVQTIAESAGVSVAAVRKAVVRGELERQSLGSVAAFIMRRHGWRSPEDVAALLERRG